MAKCIRLDQDGNDIIKLITLAAKWRKSSKKVSNSESIDREMFYLDVKTLIESHLYHLNCLQDSSTENELHEQLDHLLDAINSFRLAFANMSHITYDYLSCAIGEYKFDDDEAKLMKNFMFNNTEQCEKNLKIINSILPKMNLMINLMKINYQKQTIEKNYNVIEDKYASADVRLAINCREILIKYGISVGRGSNGKLCKFLGLVYEIMNDSALKATNTLNKLMYIEKNKNTAFFEYANKRTMYDSVTWRDLVDENGNVKNDVNIQEHDNDSDFTDLSAAATKLSKIQIGAVRQKRRS